MSKQIGAIGSHHRRMLIVEKRWMTPEEFNDPVALCLFLPGRTSPMSAPSGDRGSAAWRGVLACLFGLLGPSVVLMIATGTLYRTYGALRELRGEIRGWLSDCQFSELYAIAQAAPGPNVMFVALLGHYIAGAPGAIVSTAAMCGPTCFLADAVSRAFERFRAARLTMAIQAGLVPVTIGLIASSALIIARASDHDWSPFVVTAATFALATWTRLSPLLALAGAAALGLAGFVR